MVKKNLINPVALIAGTAMGAGFLGIPYMVARSGFLIGFIYLVLTGLFVLFVQLCLGEIVLRTKGNHHLPGYAKEYLGKKGKNFTLIIMAFAIFSSLIAYLMGGGQNLSYFLFGTLDFALYLTIIFWLILSSITYVGLRALKSFSKFSFYLIIIFVILIFLFYFRGISIDNLNYVEPSNFFFPFGIILFSFLSFSSIPSAERLLLGKEALMKKAIFLGVLIPFFVYLLFTIVMVGNFGLNVSEVATLNLNRFFVILGVLSIFTSYIALSISLRDMFRFDFNTGRFKAWLICTITPIVFFLFIHFFELFSFVGLLSIAGVVAGGLIGILVLFINLSSKHKGKRSPEYSIPLNHWGLVLLSIIFLGAIIVQLRKSISEISFSSTVISFFSNYYLGLFLFIFVLFLFYFGIRKKKLRRKKSYVCKDIKN